MLGMMYRLATPVACHALGTVEKIMPRKGKWDDDFLHY